VVVEVVVEEDKGKEETKERVRKVMDKIAPIIINKKNVTWVVEWWFCHISMSIYHYSCFYLLQLFKIPYKLLIKHGIIINL